MILANEARVCHRRQASSLANERHRLVGRHEVLGDVAGDQIISEGRVHIWNIALFDQNRCDMWPAKRSSYLRLHSIVGNGLASLLDELGVDALEDALGPCFTGDTEAFESCPQVWIMPGEIIGQEVDVFKFGIRNTELDAGDDLDSSRI